MELKEKDNLYIADTYSRFNVELVAGKGSLVYDTAYKEYVDLNSGIAVNTFGYADLKWQNEVIYQATILQHASNLYYTKPAADLAEMLCNRTSAKKVFFSNSGAEANECAIKTARLWGETNKGKEYYNVVTLQNSFHGRTMATLSATGQDVFHEHFNPMLQGFVYAELNAESVEALVKNNPCCAIMFELVQGEGGVVPLEASFVKEVVRIAKENNLLLLLDEVQTGNGRTGTLYAYEQYGFTPDILTTAKGLAGGLPLGATLFFEKTANVLTKGSHGSTFGGNPVCCAGALSVFSRIDDELLLEVRKKSAYIVKELSGAEGVLSVKGLGLMLGIETACDPNKLLACCIEKGILPIKAKNKIRLLPALNIPWELLERAINTLKECIKECL